MTKAVPRDSVALEDVDPLARFAEVTPRALAVINLRDCKEQLQRSFQEPLRLALAAKSVHLSLQAALIDALAGSANVGAYDENLRAEYLAYFEDLRLGAGTPPKSDRVMSFPQLLARAMEHPLEWSGRKLEVSSSDMRLLDRLAFVRHRVEHPRPQSHFIEPKFIGETLPLAAQLTLQLLDVCWHHYEEGQRQEAESSVAAITEFSKLISTIPEM